MATTTPAGQAAEGGNTTACVLHITSDVHLEEFKDAMPKAAVQRYMREVLPPPAQHAKWHYASGSIMTGACVTSGCRWWCTTQRHTGMPEACTETSARGSEKEQQGETGPLPAWWSSTGVTHVAVVAGDLGNPCHAMGTLEAALEYLCATFDAVVYVPGNHEYYQLRHGKRHRVDMGAVDAVLQALPLMYSNLHVLLDPAAPVRVAGVTFVGCPLWSATRQVHPDMNDYRLIYVKQPPDFPRRRYGSRGLRLLTEKDTLALHTSQLAALTSSLHSLTLAASDAGLPQGPWQAGPIVVVTHHVPVQRLRDGRRLPETHGSEDATGLLALPGLVAWVCGHTHDLILEPATWDSAVAGGGGESSSPSSTHSPEASAKERTGRCGLFCNAAGYPSEFAGQRHYLQVQVPVPVRGGVR